MTSEFCGSDFWDSDLTWNTNDPYFTKCFEATVLPFFPVAFLVVFGFIDFLNISKTKFKHKTFFSGFTVLTAIKALLTLLLLMLQLTKIVRFELEVDEGTKFFTVDYLTPSIQALGYVIVLALSLMTRFHMVRSSGVQFFFWLGTMLTQAILFRTATENYSNVDGGGDLRMEIIYMTRLVSFPVIFLRFTLECCNEALCESRGSKMQLGKPSPEKTSAFVSKLFFLWYDGLAWAGYRRTLTKDDLWDLNPDDTSRVQIDKFSKHWAKEVAKAHARTKKNGKLSMAGILKPLAKSFGITYIVGILFKLSSDMLVFIQPEMLRVLCWCDRHLAKRGQQQTAGIFINIELLIWWTNSNCDFPCLALRYAWASGIRWGCSINFNGPVEYVPREPLQETSNGANETKR